LGQKKLAIKKGSEYKNRTANINHSLKQKEADMNKVIIDLDNEDRLSDMPIRELISILRKDKIDQYTFIVYTNKVIALLKADGKYGNAQAYKGAANFFTNYTIKDVGFNEITPKFLESMESKYMSNFNNHYNGLAVYMRTVRAIYNRAIADDIASLLNYPFKQRASDKYKYKIKSEKTQKRAISKEYISLIENYVPDIKAKVNLINARLYFMFSFYLRGINLVDIAHLKVKNVENGVLVFKRVKTSRTYRIKLNEKARAILVHFGFKKKKANDYLFPIIKRSGNAVLMRMDIKNANTSINKYLNVIAKVLNIPVNLTTYVSRHSWATIADKAGVNRRIISKGLGHADLATTEIYIDDLVSTDDLEAADELITG